MKNTLSAIETLYELEKQHKKYLHISVIESVLAERAAGNVEFLCQLAQSIIYDLTHSVDTQDKTRRLIK